jgi:hypothetical protein
MRIISKFHDYYDAAQSEGQDRSLVFLRETTQFPNCHHAGAVAPHLLEFARFAAAHTPDTLVRDRRGPEKNIRLEIDFGLILFAGKLYPYARIETLNGRFGTPVEAPRRVYERAELAAILAAVDSDLDKHDKKVAKGSLWGAVKPTTAAFFGLTGSDQLRDHAMAHRLAAASWERHGDLLTENPVLSSFQLFRHLHAWQAFQELSMFWGNLAAPDRVPVTVADKDRIVQHGFDKWSFRRMPGKA